MCFSFIFLCSCSQEEAPRMPPLVFPDTELKEIIIYGFYQPEDIEELKASEKEYIQRGLIKEGELVEGRHPKWHLPGVEHVRYSTQKYCYKEAKEEDKPSVVFKNFKARIYNKNGKLLVENDLRLRHFSETHKISSFIIYLPYHKEAGYIQVVRLDGKKEVILVKGDEVYLKSFLVENSVPDIDSYRRESSYRYNEKTLCHTISSHI